jgi:hypothetical protein
LGVPASRSSPEKGGGVSQKAEDAVARLAKVGGLQTLVRGALPITTLKRLLKDAFPARAAREIPDEVWSSLAASIASESPVFAQELAKELNDRLSWDHEPRDLDGFWDLVRERPLEALWMAALSENRPVRREFRHIARHCLENYRSSPDCAAPSWEFIEGVLEIHATTVRQFLEAQKELESRERRIGAETQRLQELREDLKRLRRENSDLRAALVSAERRADNVVREAEGVTGQSKRLEEVERRALRAEREREHALRELEKRQPSAPLPSPPPAREPGPREARPEPTRGGTPAGTPRERVVRQILKKLFKKGKIGASHTHEDNVLRGVRDHEKGIAREAMDLLYREGFFVLKRTTADPHVSLNPDRTVEIRAIIDGQVESPRLLDFFRA